ncbi:MAG: hypothetical protein D6160_12895 [Ketobacter sp.]|nr:MAG: hypothetical protein D6160_12895 [Ketobacter sp.]
MNQHRLINEGVTPLASLNLGSLKKPYVALMMEVIGRALEASSQVDERIQKEVARLPAGFVFDMRALPSGPCFVMQKVGESNLKYLGSESELPSDTSLKFKHLTHAFLVLSFQEGTAQAFANDRLLVDGEIAHAMKLVRCLNRMESLILPKLIAQRALKRYPDITLGQKLSTGGRIYKQLVKNLVKGKNNV